MNVQELIDELQKIEDKTKEIMLAQGDMGFTSIQFNQAGLEIIGETVGKVWLSNADGSVEKYREKYGDAL